MAAKIGLSTRLKQLDKKPYYTLGIVPTKEGYELRRIKMDGGDVENIVTIHKCTDRAEIMLTLQMELSRYSINFNAKEQGE